MSLEGKKEATYHTHALPRSNQGCNANEEANGGKGSPATPGRAECEDDCTDKASHNATDTQTTSEDDSWAVAIADCVADEIWMCLMAECPFNRADDLAECRRMCGDGQSTEKFGRLLVGEIETTRALTGHIRGDDT